jgi:hypothetical protein
VGKLRSIKRLEKKEERLRNNCTILSKQLTKYKEIIPLAELVHSMNISGRELILFKAAVNEASEQYGFPQSSAAFHVINNMRNYNQMGALRKELSTLNFQKFAINEFCSRHSKAIMCLLALQNHGITEDRIFYINNLLEKNGYNNNINMKSNS